MKMECSTGRHRKPSPPADQRFGIPQAHHRPMRTPSLPQILLVGLAMPTGIKDALGEHGRPRRLVTPQSTGSNPVRIAILGPKCCGVTHLPCKQENWVELPVDPPMGTWPSGKAPGSQPGKRGFKSRRPFHALRTWRNWHTPAVEIRSSPGSTPGARTKCRRRLTGRGNGL